MEYKKDDIIGASYRVLLTLKVNNEYGRVTYRVRATDRRLCVLKTGISSGEAAAAGLSQLFVDQGDDYAVYRHISGETLQSYCTRMGRLKESVVKDLTDRMLLQLSSLHEGGYAHGGISADNVMVELSSDAPMPWLIGLSRAYRITLTDTVRPDLQALGHLMHLMLYGELPDKNMRIKAYTASSSDNLVVNVMNHALSGTFSTVEQMRAALLGKDTVSVSRPPKGPGFAAVGGMEDIKRRLREDVIDVLNDRAGAEAYGVTIPNGMLLYGPPGCGKTFIAEKFAEEAGFNYRYVSASDIASIYIHGTQQMIAQVFKEARTNAPTILCFDEFDALVPRREKTNNTSLSGEVNEFLTQLNNCGKEGVFVIATTNQPDMIDPAVLRTGRIDYKLFVPVPDLPARQEIFRIGLEKRPIAPDVNFRKLAERTDNYIASDISTIIQEAAREAFRSKSLITMDLLISAIKARKPSLSVPLLQSYEDMRRKIENQDKNDGHRRVGFF